MTILAIIVPPPHHSIVPLGTRICSCSGLFTQRHKTYAPPVYFYFILFCGFFCLCVCFGIWSYCVAQAGLELNLPSACVPGVCHFPYA